MRFEFSQPFNFPNFLGENHRKLAFSRKNLKNILYAFFKLYWKISGQNGKWNVISIHFIEFTIDPKAAAYFDSCSTVDCPPRFLWHSTVLSSMLGVPSIPQWSGGGHKSHGKKGRLNILHVYEQNPLNEVERRVHYLWNNDVPLPQPHVGS